jgi:hypothetical protein
VATSVARPHPVVLRFQMTEHNRNPRYIVISLELRYGVVAREERKCDGYVSF